MDQTELDLMVMHARAVIAERTLEFLLKKLSESSFEPCFEQISQLKGLLIRSMEAAVVGFEREYLSSRARTAEERNLIADEFRSVLESWKEKT